MVAIAWGASYYSEVREESVENEDELNAGHCVEPSRGMQLCAVTAGASTVSRAAHPMLIRSCFLFRRPLQLEVVVDFMFSRRSG